MKKLIMLALAAVLSFGSAIPAFAVGPHHRAGQCFDYAELCHKVAQNVLTPGLQSLNARLSAVLDMCALPLDPNAQGTASGPQVDTYATSPSLCANGACRMYLDENADGICDYHGTDCPNMGGAANDGAANGTGPGDAGGTPNGGSSYGRHHNSGHHGGYHH